MRYIMPALLGASFNLSIAANLPVCPQTAIAHIADSDQTLRYCVIDGLAVLDDIILGSHETIQRQGLPALEIPDWPDRSGRRRRQATPRSGIAGPATWPHNTLVYAFDRSATPLTRRVVLQAIQEIESQTHVRFRERTTEADYVSIATRPTNPRQPELCGLSVVGRAGGAQQLDLYHPGPSWGSCEVAHIARHELQHALGFYHRDIDTWPAGLTAREIKAIDRRYPATALPPSQE